MLICVYPRWDTADAEINVPSVMNPELTSVLSFKPRVDQNIATPLRQLPGTFSLS